MKKASPAAVAGRRLRRFLGALLVVGFGASWWSFIPPVQAAVVSPAPHMTACLPPPSISIDVKPLAIALDQIGEAIVPHAGVTPSPVKAPRPKRRRVVHIPLPVTDTPRTPDVTVNVPPTTDTPPADPVAIVMPTTDTPPADPDAVPVATPVIGDEPIRIRTRSS